METKGFWKISNGKEVILTFVPEEYGNGDGVYKLMKKLQLLIGSDFCSFQKFDERFEKLEDFDNILSTDFNLYGNRLITAHLFEFNKKDSTLTVDRKKSWKVKEDEKHEFTYSFKKTIVKCIRGWEGLKNFILGTMHMDSPWTCWGNAQFGESFLARDKSKRELEEEAKSNS